jgi:hypothetical protein
VEIKLAILTQSKAVVQKYYHNDGFQENYVPYFRRKLEKSPKILITTLTPILHDSSGLFLA